MSALATLLQFIFPIQGYKPSLLCFFSAFAFTLFAIPFVIHLVKRFRLYDVPDSRKLHQSPIPTLGGIAIAGGMLAGILLWMPWGNDPMHIAFIFSFLILLGTGITDDIKNLPARNKFLIQIALASLMALAGVRITSLEGFLGIYELPVSYQYALTILTITGVTNAFNLIDGIDGLAGTIGFMSLITTGLFLLLSGDTSTAIIAFGLSGALLAFLYYNFNPAQIFMGDSGSLIVGFVTAVLCIRLLQVNAGAESPVLSHSPVFITGIVFIPVFDTIRVFYSRMRRGISPFQADRSHIHHLLTNKGLSHALSTRIICTVHAFILLEVYLLRNLSQELLFLFLIGFMLLVIYLFKRLPLQKLEKADFSIATAIRKNKDTK